MSKPEDTSEEHKLIGACRKRLNSPSSQSQVSGVVVDLFEFTDDKVNTFKEGHVFYPTCRDRTTFDKGQGSKKGCTKSSLTVSSRFMINDADQQSKAENMVLRSFNLKHEGILKPLLCAHSKQLSKVITGFPAFNQTLTQWITTQQGKNVPREAYLSDNEKKIVSSGLEAIEEICGKGYACDGLDQPSNYAMVAGRRVCRIKIIPSAIRDRPPGETNDMVLTNLRNEFATMLYNHIRPLWNNLEFDELITLIRNPAASLEDLLGHPVLSCPGRRLVLYRRFGRHLTQGQQAMLNANLQFNPNWRTEAMKDEALRSILAGPFGADAVEVVRFCKITASHYGQHLTDKRNLKTETADKQLQRCLPVVLCRLYALNLDPNFGTA